MRNLLVILSVSLTPVMASADQYYVENGVLYQRYSKPHTYYYYGRPYTVYRYYTKEVTRASNPDWRETYLRVVNQIKQNEAFNRAVSYLVPSQQLAQSGYAPVQQQQAYAYPSAAGNTVGGFTQLEYSKFGQTNAFDLNKAYSETLAVLDTYNRYSADNQRRADEAFARGSGLVQLSQQGLAAIAEKQEDRAILQAAQGVIAETRAMVRDSFAGQAALLRESKPSPQEQFSYKQGHQQAAPQQPSEGQQPSPPPQQGGSIGELQNKYCAKCHGASVNEPAGGWVLGQSIDPAMFGALALRLSPDAPAKLSNGSAFAMPPADAPQPSVEERRELVNEFRAQVQFE